MSIVHHRETGVALADVFAGADLPRVVRAYAELSGADARSANLRHADLCNADLRGAHFDGATLTGADATLSETAGSFFPHALLDDARLQGMNKRYQGVVETDFSGADLTRATLKNSNLSGARFTNAILRRADLTRCNLSGADFSGADLTDASLAFANLSGATLRHASLVGTLLSGANLERAVLDGADLTLATLSGVRLVGADVGNTLWSKTIVARATGLHDARGLDRLRYGDPSSIDMHTLRASITALPADLLAQCGIQPSAIDALCRLLDSEMSK
jgi:uncharacterized protein YjbI with pentapeptide repeats